MLSSKLLVLLLLFVAFQDSGAVRGALFRSGRSVPFERIPGQQKLAPICREVDIFVPCLFTPGRDCVIDKLCVHETVTTGSVSSPSPKREDQTMNPLSQIAPPRRNDFLRFGRAVLATDSGDESKMPFLRIAGEPEIIFR